MESYIFFIGFRKVNDIASEDKLLELNDEIKLIDNPYHELNKIIDKYQEELK